MAKPREGPPPYDGVARRLPYPELLSLDEPTIGPDILGRARHGRRWDGHLSDVRVSPTLWSTAQRANTCGSCGTKNAQPAGRTSIGAPRHGGG